MMVGVKLGLSTKNREACNTIELGNTKVDSTQFKLGISCCQHHIDSSIGLFLTINWQCDCS